MPPKQKKIVDNSVMLTDVKAFTTNDSTDDILEYFRKHQVVLIKNTVKDCNFGIEEIKRIHLSDIEMVNATFSMETKKGEKGWGSHSSNDLFGADAVKSGTWYASFIAQMKLSKKSADTLSSSYQEFKECLPLTTLPLDNKNLKIKYTSPIWVFVGQNDQEGAPLRGRPEHIDSVNHDGTWHLQSSGTKWWFIRPADTQEWGDAPVIVPAPVQQTNPKKRKASSSTTTTKSEEEFTDGLGRLKVVVEKGDILIINTRVWWHQTRIPYTGPADYSISYAIDFFCKQLRLTGQKVLDATNYTKMGKTGAVDGSGSEGDHNDQDNEDDESGDEDEDGPEAQEYSNIDGLYASRTLKSGEVVFYESELPDCALPRSEDPTCEIVWLEDGSGALFALKDLAVGDWLTVAPSDSEDSGDEDEDEEGEEEGEEGSDGESGSGSDEECCVEGDGSDSGEGSEEDEEGSGEEEEEEEDA